MTLQRATEERLVLGWDVGGTKSSALVANARGEILEKESWASKVERGPEGMWSDFLERALPLAACFTAIGAVGVSIGGPMNPLTGEIFSPPHLPGWEGVPLKRQLEERFRLPVAVEHDAVACLLAEARWGAARGATHAVYLTSGTGFGAGMMLGGRVVRGPNGESAEVGHVRLAESGPVVFGKAGSAEAFCSGTGIGLLAQERFPLLFTEGTTAKEVAAQAEAGGVEGREVLMVSARYTGRVVALMADLFSPQVVMIGSLAKYVPAWWLDAVREEARGEVLPQRWDGMEICLGALGDRLQDLSPIAAALYALETAEGEK